MKPLLSRLQFCGLSTNARLLVGISGGRDSVALVHLLLAAGYRRLVLCHVNHRLRGRASGADERFVKRLAARLELPCHTTAVDVAALARTRGESVETAARHASYAFFAQIARKTRSPVLLLGHHADDLVETFLFNLFRGSGTRGLGNMSADSTRPVYPVLNPGPRSKPVLLRIVRPLLGIWREEIDSYVAEHRLPYREDESNAALHHTRNRIRHELLPLAKAIFGRDVAKNLWRTAEILRGEEVWMQALAASAEGDIIKDDSVSNGPPRLRAALLAAQPVALQRRILLGWLRRAGIPDVGYREVELVRSLLSLQQPAKVNLPGCWHARRRAGELFLERASR